MPNNDIAYIYVIENSQGLFKIGYSKDPYGRLARLQTGSPYGFSMVRTMRTPFYREIEKELHQRYAAKRVRGEWFELTDTDLLYIRLIGADGEPRTGFIEGAARARARYLERTGTPYLERR